jgi:hypothetical protein
MSECADSVGLSSTWKSEGQDINGLVDKFACAELAQLEGKLSWEALDIESVEGLAEGQTRLGEQSLDASFPSNLALGFKDLTNNVDSIS